MIRLAIGLSFLVGVMSCRDSKEPSTPVPVPAVRAEGTEPGTPPEENAPAPGGKTIEIKGLKVTFATDGKVKISGTDRWGNAIDNAYQDRGFFEKAIPSLALYVTQEQADGLKALPTSGNDAQGRKSDSASRSRP